MASAKNQRSGRAIVAILALLALASAGHAWRLLQPGPQTLQGVVVPDDQGFCLLLAPGTRGQQAVPLATLGNDREELAKIAVARRPRDDRYEDIPRTYVFGNGVSSRGSFFLVVNRFGPTPELVKLRSSSTAREAIKARLRMMILDGDDAKAAHAFTVLERKGLLDAMIEQAGGR